MEAKNVISQEEKLNSLEGIHYKYEYHPEYKRCDIEFEIDETCDQRIFNFIENLYQNSKGSNFQLDAIQDDKQKAIMELLLKHKPASNTNRPISAEIKIHEAKFSIKITSKKNMLTEAQKIQLIRHWNVPNLPAHFIGRKHLLEQLAQRLNPRESQTSTVILTALHGLGGVGKTFLAARYAQLYAKNYSFILWLNAESETTLINDYRLFAEAIQLPVEKQPSENIVMMVKNWLRQQSNWLIIYDNAPEDKLIKNFRPANGGKILITSRKDAWLKKDSLAIDVFSPEEARAYIVELTGFSLNDYQVTIDELAKTLGHLPLALAQACAYIAVNHLSLEEYLMLYAESRAEMLADKTMPAETNHEPVAITWNITFKAIEKQNSAASVLLESCAFLQGSSIPEFLLKELFAKQKPELAKQMKPFIDVMSCLLQYSMLKLIHQEKEKAFSIHNLVQEVIFDSLPSKKRRIYRIEIIQLLMKFFPANEVDQVEDYAKQRSLLSHLENCLQMTEQWLNEVKEDVAEVSMIENELIKLLLLLSARVYRNQGREQQQKESLERALTIQNKYHGKDHLITEHILEELANAYGELGNLLKKKELLEQVLMIKKQHYRENHPEIGRTLDHLATTYSNLGDRLKRIELLKKALVIFENHYGKDHLEVARTLNNLANTPGDFISTPEKRAMLKRALVIKKKRLGETHPEVAHSLSNLANTYEVKKASKKKKLLERALVIKEQHYGKNHPEVARTFNNLAVAWRELGDVNQDKVTLERALIIQEEYYGKNHPEVAKILYNLASANFILGDLPAAKEITERAYHIFFNHPNAGPQHHDTLKLKERLALLKNLSPEQISKFLEEYNKNSIAEKNSLDLAKALRNAANQNNVEKLKELLPQIITLMQKMKVSMAVRLYIGP